VNAGVFGAALLLAFGAKAFYASANADALRWLLGPTTALVSALSGRHFEPEAGVGYLCPELALLIAPSCAGLNYLVIAFCLLVFGFAPQVERPARRWAWLLAAAALAYAATLWVNATRIVLAIELRAAQLPVWLAPSEAHRLLGVAIYLGSLWLLFLVVARGFGQRGTGWRTALLPLGLYLGLTLGVPLANGAAGREEFWAHARVVLGASLGLTVLGWAAIRVGNRVRKPA
jgi:exosortase K